MYSICTQSRDPTKQKLPSKPEKTTTAHPVRIAKQLVIPLNTTKATPATTDASIILTVVPRNLPAELRPMIAARVIAEVLLNQHIIVRNFSMRLVRFPKHMVIAYTEEPPATIHEHRDRLNSLPRATFEKQWNTYCQPQIRPQMDATTYGQNTIDAVSAVHNKPHVDRTMKMARHTTVCDKDSQSLSRHRRDEIHFSNDCEQYGKKLFDILSELSSCGTNILEGSAETNNESDSQIRTRLQFSRLPIERDQRLVIPRKPK